MSNLSIKDVPEPWAEALRQRAARNHRSLQGELLSLIEAAVHESALPAPGTAPPLAAPNQRTGAKTIAQIVAELNLRHPNPAQNHALPRGVDITREERDAR